jgi:hypothetical protein
MVKFVLFGFLIIALPGKIRVKHIRALYFKLCFILSKSN